MHPEATKAKAQELLEQGYSIRDVAAAVGASFSYVQRLARGDSKSDSFSPPPIHSAPAETPTPPAECPGLPAEDAPLIDLCKYVLARIEQNEAVCSEAKLKARIVGDLADLLVALAALEEAQQAADARVYRWIPHTSWFYAALDRNRWDWWEARERRPLPCVECGHPLAPLALFKPRRTHDAPYELIDEAPPDPGPCPLPPARVKRLAAEARIRAALRVILTTNTTDVVASQRLNRAAMSILLALRRLERSAGEYANARAGWYIYTDNARKPNEIEQCKAAIHDAVTSECGRRCARCTNKFQRRAAFGGLLSRDGEEVILPETVFPIEPCKTAYACILANDNPELLNVPRIRHS